MKQTFLKLFIIIVSFIIILPSSLSFACTDFRLTGKDGTVLITRSMEYALDLKSNVRTSLQGRKFTTQTPDGKPGLAWQAKYGYVFLDALNVDIAVDGMNERGLSFEALYLPGLAQYQTIPTGKENQAIGYLNFGDWILCNFDSVDQVRNALANVYVFTQQLPGQSTNVVFPLHYAVYDASGKGIIIEYIGGKLNIYDNTVGTLTNSPSYDWHIANLHNYTNLIPENPAPVIDNGLTFAATGQGFGMVGVPGDISPPSRFIKINTLQRVVIPGQDTAATLNLAQHIINNVDIPLGLVRENGKNTSTNELTQWVVFKDLTNKVFYYRTYDDLTLHSIDLSKIDFSTTATRLKMPIADQAYIKDMTSEFLNQKMSS